MTPDVLDFTKRMIPSAGPGLRLDDPGTLLTNLPSHKRTVAQPGLERYIGVVEVASSNLVGPTKIKPW